jgi:hypothetical protein
MEYRDRLWWYDQLSKKHDHYERQIKDSGDLIALVQKHEGISLREMARRCGYSAGLLSLVSTGKQPMSPNLFYDLLLVFYPKG